jgi:serine O-acetyltransferase
MTRRNYFSRTLSADTLYTTRTELFAPQSLSGGLPPALPIVLSKTEVHQFADGMLDYLFPIRCQPVEYVELADQLRRLLDPLAVDTKWVAEEFLATLPALYDKLLEDAQDTLAFDPAANSLEEVIVAYPGFYATAVYRIAHELVRLGVSLLPRMLTEYAHSKTGIDIHPAAQIGRAFVIDHGTGTVIGATALVGNHVKIYHGVTLGALQVDKSLANTKRHPTIGDYVIIYANATVLGGQTTIGHHSILGGNIWLTQSVPPHSHVYQESKVSIRTP